MRIALELILAVLFLPASSHAQGRVFVPRATMGPAAPGVIAVAPVARLNTVVLNSLSLTNASSLPTPTLVPAAEGTIATPLAFKQLVQQQSAMRVNAVVERLAKMAAPSEAPKATAPRRISLSQPRVGGLGLKESVRQGEETDPEALAALDAKTGVDIQELSDAVNDVMSGFTPSQINAMSDEDFAGGAERILAALAGSLRARRGPLITPERGNPSPERTAAFIKEIAPEIQRMANAAFNMDHVEPKSCEACGPVSLAVRGPLRAALRRKFPDADIDVVLEPGALLEEGAVTPHVFLKIVRRTGAITIQPLAIADFTAAQKPANVKALGLNPGEPVILPWEGASREDPYTPRIYKRYPIAQFSGAGALDTIKRVEAARGPLSVDLERRLNAYLSN